MKTTEEVMTCFTLLSVMCACAMAYQSAPLQINSNPDDIEHILNDLRNVLHISNIDDIIHPHRPSYSVSDIHPQEADNDNQLKRSRQTLKTIQQHPLLSALLSRTDDSKSFDVNKRQGSWDYDYGLGGGRFGKRSGMFADYSLGGGRFGRDLDHAKQLKDSVVDFEDPLDL